MVQSELQLEENLVERLTRLGYERVSIPDTAALEQNLKRQLEKLNKITLSEPEFKRVLNHLDRGSVFERAKTLRDRMQLTRDDGTAAYLQFLDSENWCQNLYQVTNQITVKGRRKNRYDVTLLINGFPLVQVELKRRGMEIKEAFNQVNRYHRHSYGAGHGLFQYIQLFVISNGVNSKYYANNRKQHFKQTFYWADRDNNLITQLDDFADVFLEKCHLSKMICKHIVLHESDKVLMVLRPYQYYAVEAIVERVKKTRKNGYIWHTTGSGKTLTSFKAAQLLTALDEVHKVIFVVDRADLDYQTTREFNFFSEGSVDGTDNTRALVRQLSGDNKLIVTTIQKLNTAITRSQHAPALEAIQDKRVVFIFDECHRSQFGETHKAIVKFFSNAQLFGFTGTPIFADNAIKKRTTKDLFDEQLHRYVITNAIADGNVLKFSVEYWGKLKRKDGTLIDEKVDAINTKEFFEHEERLEGVVDWIITNHNRKTHGKGFSSIFCVANIDTLIKYYDIFQRKKEAGEHDLRVVTIFTYKVNEEDPEANGLIGEPDFEVDSGQLSTHSRDKLESYIDHYNAMYSTQHSAKDSTAFYTYYKDIAKRVKERDREGFLDKDRADILLVVNMFLTGFDAKKLNTLYVDKNLRYHGLIQAYSRTNRILDSVKSQGNIVSFRNLKDNTDQAITLYSDPNANEDILLEPYEHYVEKFNEGVAALKAIADTPNDVNALISEDDKLEFVQAFRTLIRELNVLTSFTEFDFGDLDLPEQAFMDFRSKYLDVYEESKTTSGEEQASILNELDFELELIVRDEINVSYILRLLEDLNATDDKAKPEEYDKKKKAVLDTLGQETQLRSKRELIEKFMTSYMPKIKPEDNFRDIFDAYWSKEKKAELDALSQAEGMKPDALKQLLSDYQFSGKEPLREDVFAALEVQPRLLERKKVYERVTDKLVAFVRVFEDDMGDLES